MNKLLLIIMAVVVVGCGKEAAMTDRLRTTEFIVGKRFGGDADTFYFRNDGVLEWGKWPHGFDPPDIAVKYQVFENGEIHFQPPNERTFVCRIVESGPSGGTSEGIQFIAEIWSGERREFLEKDFEFFELRKGK